MQICKEVDILNSDVNFHQQNINKIVENLANPYLSLTLGKLLLSNNQILPYYNIRVYS